MLELSRAAAQVAARDTLRRFGVVVRRGASRQEAANERVLRTAEDVARAVSSLRGVTIKLAQLASYLDPEAPEPLRATLARFQEQAPSMDPELALATIERALGERMRLIAELDEEPVAAASIGQVHRATLRDGTEVAIKVQYPDARALIETDLQSAGPVFDLLRLVVPALGTPEIVDELTARIREELDYRHEAATQAWFWRAWRDHPRIVIPRPIPALTTSEVLTSEWIEGASFAQASELAQPERDAIGEILFRFVFGSLYRLRHFNGDPHPGNYKILPGPRVAFLDFGFARRFAASEMAIFEALLRARVLEPDPEAFAAAVHNAGLLASDTASTEAIWEFFAPFYDLVAERGPRRVTPAYASSLVRHTFDRRHPLASALRVPRSFVVVQRINLGLYALLGALEASADWRAIAEEIWPFVGAEPGTPIGKEEALWRSKRP